jgi:hypothetical protein
MKFFHTPHFLQDAVAAAEVASGVGRMPDRSVRALGAEHGRLRQRGQREHEEHQELHFIFSTFFASEKKLSLCVRVHKVGAMLNDE